MYFKILTFYGVFFKIGALGASLFFIFFSKTLMQFVCQRSFNLIQLILFVNAVICVKSWFQYIEKCYLLAVTHLIIYKSESYVLHVMICVLHIGLHF